MKKDPKVFASIIAANLLNLEDEILKLEEAKIDGIHFDVMDGNFVPSLTMGSLFLKHIRKMTSLHLDVHLMVQNTDFVFNDYILAGADALSFHQETTQHLHRVCEKVKSANKKVGIVLNPSTHWMTIEYLFPIIDQVTIMTVDPGFSGQSHLSFLHKKIKDLSDFKKNRGFCFDILIDGGVTNKNSQILVDAGADILVSGSYIFSSSDYKESIFNIKNFVL